MARVFVTGAAGFLGAVAVRELEARGHHVIGLQRQPSTAPNRVQGDLLTPSTYEQHLQQVDVVVHLAAVTGKAAPEEYARVNVEGTRTLLETARRAGVQRVLFCSSIAVTFPDQRRYFYAQSKLEAERVVAESGLRFTTIRPAIVGGPGSPVLAKLEALARLPVVPLFGDGRVNVQPIHVDDLATFIGRIVTDDRFSGEVLEFGGPEVATLRALLERMRGASGGRPPMFLPIPLAPLVFLLRVGEPLVYNVLPITLGQLATFRFDGVARPNDLWQSVRSRLKPVVEGTRPAA